VLGRWCRPLIPDSSLGSEKKTPDYKELGGKTHFRAQIHLLQDTKTSLYHNLKPGELSEVLSQLF
jgi:hypothetical protein